MTNGESVGYPKGIGDVPVSWPDDNVKVHNFLLRNALYFPNSNIKVICIPCLPDSYLDKQNNLDEEETFVASKISYSVLHWDRDKYQHTFCHSDSKIPEISLNYGFEYFQTSHISTDSSIDPSIQSNSSSSLSKYMTPLIKNIRKVLG